MIEDSDLPVTRTHSYGFSGGSLLLGSFQEYKGGNLFFDENKLDKNSIAKYYFVMENVKSEIYLKHYMNFSLDSLPISNFSESNKVIHVVPKKIYSIVELEIISFRSDNSIIKNSLIPNEQIEYLLESETSYIEIKSKYLDKNGTLRTVSERKTSFDLMQNSFYTRMLTDDKGFLINECFVQIKFIE